MAGRKPKPTGQKIAEGNPGRRELPAEPEFDEIGNEPPMKLSALARKLWDDLLVQLKKNSILKSTDAYILAAFCDCWSRFATNGKRVERLEYLKQARQLAASLGLSPTDRARLGIKGGDKKDELDEFEKEGARIHGKGKMLDFPSKNTVNM